jgi:hypothetical protein
MMASPLPLPLDRVQVLLAKAAQISVLIPSREKSEVLWSAGMTAEESDSEEMKNALSRLDSGYLQTHGLSSLDNVGRCERILRLKPVMCRHPLRASISALKLTDMMKLVGFDDIDAKSGSAAYMRCYRALQQQSTNNTVQPLQPQQSVPPRPPPIAIPAGIDTVVTGDNTTISQLSSSPRFAFERTEEPDDFFDNHFVWPLPFFAISPDYEPALQQKKSALMPLPTRTKPVSIQTLTTTQSHRQTTQAAHQERQMIIEARNIRSSMHKVGSLLWQTVSDGNNTLKVFDTPEKCADLINRMSGISCLSGYDLKGAVERGEAGKSPPRRGRSSSIPDDVFGYLCFAVFSLSTIQQINNSERFNRSQLESLVGDVVNDKRESDGVDALGTANLYHRIELRNSNKQELQTPDKREALRVRWLTFTSQKKNYERWEQAAVELGFARLPFDNEETHGQHIIWFEGQERNVINFDEMSFSLDASTTQGGGRPSQVPNTLGVHGSGEAAPKSDAKITAIFGMNFADEAMPPYLVFPTKAKTEDRYKLKAQMLTGLRQVNAQFGYNQPRYFDVGFGMNPKGASIPLKSHFLLNQPVLGI